MKRADAREIKYDSAEIFGIPVMFTVKRIAKDTVPKGIHRYEMRHADEDWCDPCQLGYGILVNFYGTILSREPLQMAPDGKLDMETEDFWLTDDMENTPLQKYMEKYPVVEKDLMKMCPVELNELELFFSVDEKTDQEQGCVGHLRGDFGDGNQFYTSWWPHQNDRLNTETFKEDFQRVMDWMRSDGGFLKNFNAMRRCALYETGYRLSEENFNCFGYKVETNRYKYLFRMMPILGDYNFYVYCYDKEAAQKKRSTPKKKKNIEMER